MDRQVYNRMAANEETHWWFVARRKILKEALSTYVKLPQPATILEAGCGTGGNLSMLACFGMVSAFEPDAEARKMADKKGNYDIRDGSLPDEIPFREGQFDLVTALDVVEHVEDDLTSLQALWHQLRPNGWLLLTVPAYPFLWSEHDRLHHHKQRYYKGELLQKITDAGFNPIKATYFNALLFPLVASIRLINKTFRLEGIRENSTPNRLVNGILRSIFTCERLFIGRLPLPMGLSLLVIARRDNSHLSGPLNRVERTVEEHLSSACVGQT